MINKIFSVYDKQTKLYSTPFFNNHPLAARRMFSINVNQEGSVISEYPEDYKLMEIGTFDDDTGKVEKLDPPVCVAEAKELRKEKDD